MNIILHVMVQTNNQVNYALEHLHSAVNVVKTGSCPVVIG